MAKLFFKLANLSGVRLSLLFARWTSLVLLSFSGAASATQIGPGSHWIDSAVSGGQDSFASIMIFGIDLPDDGLNGLPDFDLTFKGGPGTTVVERSTALDDSANFPGLRAIDGHSDVIDTEIVSMSLTGTGGASGWTLRAGINQGLGLPSLGVVAEQPTNSFLADSFFDVFFEIDIPGMGIFHNNDALRVEAVVDRLPPIGIDYNANMLIGAPLPIFNANNDHVANITELTSGGTGHHTPVPEPTTIALLGLGLAGIGFSRRKPT